MRKHCGRLAVQNGPELFADERVVTDDVRASQQIAGTPFADPHDPAAYAASVVKVVGGQVPHLKESGAGDLFGQVGVAEPGDRGPVYVWLQYSVQSGEAGRIPLGGQSDQAPQDRRPGEVGNRARS